MKIIVLFCFVTMTVLSGCSNDHNDHLPLCSGNNTLCVGKNVCVNLQNDNNNCGACGVVCEQGFACNQGACTCTSTQNDPLNCGSCGFRCDPSTPICVSGICKKQ